MHILPTTECTEIKGRLQSFRTYYCSLLVLGRAGYTLGFVVFISVGDFIQYRRFIS